MSKLQSAFFCKILILTLKKFNLKKKDFIYPNYHLIPKLNQALDQYENTGNWMLACFAENFFYDYERVDDDQMLKDLYAFGNEKSIINLLRVYCEKKLSNPGQFQTLLKKYLLAFVDDTDHFNVNTLKYILRHMNKEQTTEIEKEISIRLIDSTSPYDYAAIEILLSTLETIDSNKHSTKEAVIFRKLKNYKRYSIPSKKEKIAFSQYCPDALFPDTANQVLPYHTLLNSDQRYDVLAKEVHESNMLEITEIFRILNIDSDQVHIALLHNIIAQLNTGCKC